MIRGVTLEVNERKSTSERTQSPAVEIDENQMGVDIRPDK
jgi:hypothetical protein